MPLVVRFADSAEQKANKAARMGRAYDRWAVSVRGSGSDSAADWPGAYGPYPGGGELRGSISSAGPSGPLRDAAGGAGGFRLGLGAVRERESSIYIKYLPETVGPWLQGIDHELSRLRTVAGAPVAARRGAGLPSMWVI